MEGLMLQEHRITKVFNFGNALCFDCDKGETMLESIREQMARYEEHDIKPEYVLMNLAEYKVLRVQALINGQVRHNSDENSVNGLPIIICENVVHATVTTSPGELMSHGLL